MGLGIIFLGWGTYEEEPFGQNTLKLGEIGEELGHFGVFFWSEIVGLIVRLCLLTRGGLSRGVHFFFSGRKLSYCMMCCLFR
jgi:hypothetical protein